MNFSKVVEVQLISAKELVAADRGGTSDPFLVASLPTSVPQRYQTDTKLKTLTPEWKETVSFYLTESDTSPSLQVECWDFDLYSDNDSIGSVAIPISEIPPTWFDLQGVKHGKIEIAMKIRDANPEEELQLFLAEPPIKSKRPKERGLSYFPLKGSVYPPTHLLNETSSLDTPDKSLVLDHVYGYRGFDSSDNLFVNKEGNLVYPMAAVGIVLNIEKNSQQFFMHHGDDIVAMAMHPNKDFIASGQIASLKEGQRKPKIFVWSSVSPQSAPLADLGGLHERSIAALEFSQEGDLLLSVGLDDKHSISVTEWKTSTVLASAPGHSAEVTVLKANPYQKNTFVSAGVKHIRFWSWTLSDPKKKADKIVLSHVDGKFGKYPKETITSLGFTSDGTVISGGMFGSIFGWKDSIPKFVVTPEKSLPIFSISVFDSAIVAGSKQGKLFFFTSSEVIPEVLDLDNASSLDSWKTGENLHRSIKSITGSPDALFVGTSRGEIISVTNKLSAQSIVQGHWSELWGCATHPKRDICATSGNDNSLRVWDLEKKRQLRSIQLNSAALCLDFNHLGNFMTVGLKSGSILIVPSARDKEMTEIPIDSNARVVDIKFSPSGDRIAVGMSSGQIAVLQNDPKAGWKKIGTCKGHSACVTHLDWSEDGFLLQSDSSSYEHLFWEMEDIEQVKKTISVRDVKFASNTCVLGYTISGIWQKGADGTDINGLHVSHNQNLVATGDDFGMVSLFAYPTLKGALKKVYSGHSSHVTNVRFTHDDKMLVSTGGGDAAVFQWRVIDSNSPKAKRKEPKMSVSSHSNNNNSNSKTNSPKLTGKSIPTNFKSEQELRAQVEKEIRSQLEKEITAKLEKQIEARLRSQIEKEIKQSGKSTTSATPTKAPAVKTGVTTPAKSPKPTTSTPSKHTSSAVKPTVTKPPTKVTPTKVVPSKATATTPAKPEKPEQQGGLEKRVESLEKEMEKVKETLKLLQK